MSEEFPDCRPPCLANQDDGEEDWCMCGGCECGMCIYECDCEEEEEWNCE